MPTNLYNRLYRRRREAGAGTAARLPRLTAAEQTKLTWAKPVKSFAEVPDAFKDFFGSFQSAGQAFPYALLTPSYQRFLHSTSEKLICDCGSEIAVLERSGNTILSHCFPLAGIRYVEVTSILLDYSIQINGVTSAGLPSSAILRCNSVSDYLFTPIVEKIRYAAIGSKEAVQSSELEAFDAWARSSYKFMNYAKRSLLGGEKLIHAVLQPEFRTSRLEIFGLTYYSRISPALVCILTDRELIVIREAERKRAEDKYGGIWDYIPLKNIASLSLRQAESNNLVLSIQLPDSACLEFLFQASTRPAIDQLLHRYKELTG
jgi:hypothetical protein